MNKENYFEKTGLLVPEILLPSDGVDMTKWAVVACDQFTSSPEYWERVENTVGNSPSTLRLTLPEIYLGNSDEATRIEKINNAMDEYIANGTLKSQGEGFIYIKRHLADGKIRTGLLVALDLEKYDYTKGSKTLIRATEGTVISRIPPRMKVRKNASIELPHVLMLINDKMGTVFDKVEKSSKKKSYMFDLMEDGGSLEGYLIQDVQDIKEINDKLESLITDDGLLFAVGDGNHSFAAAKSHWENLKKEGAPEFHPARFCMCEIENIHDNGIVFEPIHRVLFDTDFDTFTDLLTSYFGENASVIEDVDSKKVSTPNDDTSLPYHTVKVFSEGKSETVYMDKKLGPLAVGLIQSFIDNDLPEAKIDYVHDEAEVKDIVGKNKNSIGILLPPPQKSGLFDVVEKGEVLPRKTFSMGDARTKRYYVEARRIR